MVHKVSIKHDGTIKTGSAWLSELSHPFYVRISHNGYTCFETFRLRHSNSAGGPDEFGTAL